ncbi:MAG: SAM-dependent methyltransferase [Gammaproteobacteria bacterium]|nr:SAM-dependent methyltransferase [Gammaproteobacteria bacterium]MCF6230809.1 SAM-dependent methyltransferase [Gammaproteobacteria bacterium]
MSYSQKLRRLDQLLGEYSWLWQPQPFKQQRPAWCDRLPTLYKQLLALSDDTLSAAQGEQAALLALLTPHLAALSEIGPLTTVADAPLCALTPLNPRFHAAIPGRKWQQVQAFCAATGEVKYPILEWCGGKGHLGRLMAAQWRQSVVTLEWQASLCQAGRQLAKRSKVKQRFKVVDVLTPLPSSLIQQQHAIALHACGELHRSLIRQSIAKQLPALDIAPCCYYRIPSKTYIPFNETLALRPDYNALRLAVTEAVTASPRELTWRDREMAWKLAYELILQQQLGLPYQPIKPINKQWLRGDFKDFCQNLAQRDGYHLPENVDWRHYQTAGLQRQRETMRLSLPRFAFRRALEMWLVLDMACYLERSGYTVRVSRFCDRTLTPRNLLLSARRLP